MYRQRLTNQSIGNIMNDITEMPLDGSVWIEAKSGRSRTAAQNRLAFLWYNFISTQIDGGSKEDTRLHCKLTYGVPILCESSEQFMAMWQKQSSVLAYEEQLQLMKYIAVTSLFTVKEFTEYLQSIEQGYASISITLPTSDEAYYEAMGYRV